jgi:hypothetical protein
MYEYLTLFFRLFVFTAGMSFLFRLNPTVTRGMSEREKESERERELESEK